MQTQRYPLIILLFSVLYMHPHINPSPSRPKIPLPPSFSNPLTLPFHITFLLFHSLLTYTKSTPLPPPSLPFPWRITMGATDGKLNARQQRMNQLFVLTWWGKPLITWCLRKTCNAFLIFFLPWLLLLLLPSLLVVYSRISGGGGKVQLFQWEFMRSD